MPKKSAGAIPHHKSQMIGEALPTVINTMPKTAPMGPSTYFRIPTPLTLFYLVAITLHQRCEPSWPNLHNHFPKRAWLKWTKFLTPKPPASRGEHTFSQATKECLKHSSEDPHKKFLWTRSNLSATATGMVNKERKVCRKTREGTLQESKSTTLRQI